MMTTKQFMRAASTLLATFAFAATAFTAAGQQPDNTGANKTNQDAATADQQKENAADRDLAKKIRQSIVDDKSLSTYAHNVKIIVRNGNVTLKGPVKTEDDKAAIESKATALAGAGNVQNEITVKSPSH
jgi:osmotically-inducible protein OsmY